MASLVIPSTYFTHYRKEKFERSEQPRFLHKLGCHEKTLARHATDICFETH
jgi:hypothetical protein